MLRKLICGVVLLAMLAGCTRTRYRISADRDAYGILAEKSAFTPWLPPPSYSVIPDPRSRLFDPTPIDAPLLPIPAPQLYAYQLPDLPERDPARFRSGGLSNGMSMLAGPTSVELERLMAAISIRRLPPLDAVLPATPSPAVDAWQRNVDWQVRQAGYVAGETSGGRPYENSMASAAERMALQPVPVPQAVPSEPLSPPASRELPGDAASSLEAELEEESELPVVPIPASAWNSIPISCQIRMFEFGRVREEYGKTFGREPGPSLRDPSRRLSLEDIVELAVLNSREYQTQKETLYRAALRLSLERFDYELKFAPTGNSTAANYTHNRSGGVTVNTLAVPTQAQMNKMLATGGDLLARFANDVVLTFNGPDGFAADVGSELLFNLSQSVFQRDIRFESLTQSERDVVYAARDFGRFRKSFFAQLATDYYNLIRTYRNIEIDSQNYFSFVRAFDQGTAEYRAGVLARIGLDQIEQQVLGRRSTLISRCNGLENSLDSLKIRIGLPPEMRLNVDLRELDQITLRDELAVTGDLILRVRRRLAAEREAAAPNRVVLVSSGVVLGERMLEALELQRRLGEVTIPADELDELKLLLQVDESRINVRLARIELEQERGAESPSLPIVFYRSLGVVDEVLKLVANQARVAVRIKRDGDRIEDIVRRRNEIKDRAQQLRAELEALIAESRLQQLPDLVRSAEQLLATAEQLAREGDELIGAGPAMGLAPEEEMRQIMEQIDRMLRISEALLRSTSSGLVPVEIDMDDAMLTALVLRFDLINERGFLADDRRQIKLAADELKSVLNLNATQSIFTRRDVNRPFDFTFDDSQTRVSATLDTPLNRRAQRNAFRQSLINYQAALRRLTQLEDGIKLSVRFDLRDLRLNSEQYVISVASAALAFERVVSTETELRLGLGNVSARDFNEAQNTYTVELSNVASRHIDYILGRMQLFLDLELLTVNDDGFWPEIYSERYQPTPSFQLPSYALPAYGELPRGVLYSRRTRRIMDVPTGVSAIQSPEARPPQPQSRPEPVPAEPLPLPALR